MLLKGLNQLAVLPIMTQRAYLEVSFSDGKEQN